MATVRYTIERVCLKCDTEFRAEHKFIRLCPYCKMLAERVSTPIEPVQMRCTSATKVVYARVGSALRRFK